MTFSAEFDQELIPHAVEHYKNVGLDPQYFLITLHHQLPNAPVLDKLTTWLRQEYGIPHVQTWHGNFTSQKNCDMRFKHRKAAKVKKCDWILKFDADELLRVPGGNMIRFLDFLGDQGFDSLSGNWIDRVADEGRLVDISAKPSIAEQFPLGCRFSALAGNATTRKLVAFRGYLKEKRAGHSLAKGLETCRYPAQLMIDHYKWSRPVYEKLRRRMEHYRNLEGVYWWKESEAFLNHIDENQGRVDVHREDFRCEDIRERMTMVHSYFPVEDGRAEADAEPCSRVRICPNKLR